MKAVILAAGMGTRLRPLTNNIAKAMVDLGRQTLLERILFQLSDAGVDEALIVVGYKRESITEVIGDGRQYKVRVTYVQQDEMLGTGHALLLAKEFLHDPFLLIFADTYFHENYIQNVAAMECDCVIGVNNVDFERAKSYGIIEINHGSGMVERIVEKPVHPPSTKAILGLYKLHSSVFSYLDPAQISKRGEVELPDAVNKMISSGMRCCFYEMACAVDIASIADLERARQLAATWQHDLE